MFRKLPNVLNSRKNIIRNYGNKIINLIKDAQVENFNKENFQYLLILDLEATCDKNNKVLQEIIEFPCLKINAKTLKEESRFHYYVKPNVNPTLSDFCIELTGILQDVVDKSKYFPNVLSLFENWRDVENLTEYNSIYITSGDWDLGHMIPNQCKLDNLNIPEHMKQWIDLKKMYTNNFNKPCISFADIMKAFDFKFVGRPHSGIDDCRNMLKVVEKFGQLGLNFTPTCQLVNFNSNWKVHVIDSKKYVIPTIWNQDAVKEQNE